VEGPFVADIPKYITTAQLQVVKSVLLEGGYSDDIWATSPPNAEAQALIALVQDGTNDPIDLARELETRFGQSSDGSAALKRSIDQLADHGLLVHPALEPPPTSSGG
jgi:hypothetical protein